MKTDLNQVPDMTFMGLTQPQRISDLFNAKCKIVPGIPSIEQLPPSLSDDPTYFFSGPLLLEDYIIEEFINSSPLIMERSVKKNSLRHWSAFSRNMRK